MTPAKQLRLKERKVTRAFEKALRLWKKYKAAQEEANKLYRELFQRGMNIPQHQKSSSSKSQSSTSASSSQL